MTITLSSPDTWKPLSGSSRLNEITSFVRGRFNEQIDAENFQIREEPGYTEVSRVDKSRGYCFAQDKKGVARSSIYESRVDVMRINYQRQQLIITDEFISHENMLAGFAWRRP